MAMAERRSQESQLSRAACESPLDRGSWASSDVSTPTNQSGTNGHGVRGKFVGRPRYCSDASEYTAHVAGAPFQSAIEPLLLQAGVDVMMTGHEHGYERIHPTSNGTVTTRPTAVPTPRPGHGSNLTHVYHKPSAPLGVMVGSAGGLQEDHWVNPQPVWSAFRVTANLTHPWDGYGYIMMVR